MVYIYPIAVDLTGEYFDLKYSLRSLFSTYTPKDIILVGPDRPSWLGDINFIECGDVWSFKEANIIGKIIRASLTIKGDFVMMNDDYFFLRPIEFETPLFKGYDLNGNVKNPAYKKAYRNTKLILDILNKDTIDYDGHYPHVMNTHDIEYFIKNKFWLEDLYVFKSLYFNIIETPVKMFREDVKNPTASELEKLDFFSTGEYMPSYVKAFITKKFQTKSPCEN